jgi:hypothetical protein
MIRRSASDSGLFHFINVGFVKSHGPIPLDLGTMG